MLWLNEEFNEYNECVGVLIILLNVWWYDIMQEIWISLPLRAWNLGNIYMLRLREDLMNTMSSQVYNYFVESMVVCNNARKRVQTN